MPDISVCFNRGMQHQGEVDWVWQKMQELKPKSILEIGTGSGGATGIWALDGALVLSVDRLTHIINQCYFLKPDYLAQQPNPNVVFLNGNSHSDETKELVLGFQKEYDWVVIDAGHSLADGQKDFDLYSPLARQAILLHDIVGYQSPTNPDWFPTAKWPEFKKQFKTDECVDFQSGGWGIIYLDADGVLENKMD